MRLVWGTVVILGLLVALGGRARAEGPRLVLSASEQQALGDARQIANVGVGLSAIGSAAGVSGLVMGSFSLFRDRVPEGVAPAAIGLAVAGPILVGVGVALVVAGRKLDREVRAERSDRRLAVGPGGFAVRF